MDPRMCWTAEQVRFTASHANWHPLLDMICTSALSSDTLIRFDKIHTQNTSTYINIHQATPAPHTYCITFTTRVLSSGAGDSFPLLFVSKSMRCIGIHQGCSTIYSACVSSWGSVSRIYCTSNTIKWNELRCETMWDQSILFATSQAPLERRTEWLKFSRWDQQFSWQRL